MNTPSLMPSERITFALRELYNRYGYSRYKMNKFEEYDLYARNKDFLISDSVITFTDTNGKLMALKPDVTLSIVKNTQDAPGQIQKVYYNENVYRVSKGTRTFQEIMQVGLEAIGDVDDYCIWEVMTLAAESLSETGHNCILEVSHLGLLNDVIRWTGIPEGQRASAIHWVGEKNQHALLALCRSLGIADERSEVLRELAALYGSPTQVLPRIRQLLTPIAPPERLNRFDSLLTALCSGQAGDRIRIDFSAVSDPKYYNGFVFRGFAEGIPAAVLSGGQYDIMMEKMHRRSKAIGFAVYLDMLEQYSFTRTEYDVDTLILYDGHTSADALRQRIRELTASGTSILALKYIPDGLRYRNLEDLQKEGAEHA